MSARPVLQLVQTADRRRATTLGSISHALQAQELTVRATVPTLSNRDAAVTLEVVRMRLEHELTRIESLVDEFRELAEQEQDEGSE